jgi:hypothetical protein
VEGNDTQAAWAVLPSRARPRLFLPTSRHAARASLLIYHPVTLRGRAGWELGLRVLSRGAGRVLPQRPLPSRVQEILMPLVPPGGTVTVATTNHADRFVAITLNEGGRPQAFAKIALSQDGIEALRREEQGVRDLGSLLKGVVFAPGIVDASHGLLLYDAVDWRPRAAAWRLPDEVAHSLGRLFAATHEAGTGAAHGDLAPWNLLRTERGWALVDWEEARFGLPPFFDVFHFLVQANIDLRLPTKAAIVRATRLQGWAGRVVEAYARGAEIDPRSAGAGLAAYLDVSGGALDPSEPDHVPGLRARRRLGDMAA